jgi:hypothetical protein
MSSVFEEKAFTAANLVSDAVEAGKKPCGLVRAAG